MYDCICPYCDKGMENPDDCYEPNTLYEEECPHCGLNFVFEVEYSITYNTKQASCLNGGNHDYKKTDTFPIEFTRLRCTMCGDEQPLKMEG